MSIISNEHQSGSPFEQEPSEPGCICCRGVRCPLHGGPPQPGPEPMTTDHQPGSPHVDLDELESEGHEWDHGQLLRAARSLGAELRTLRARVAEFEMPDAEADRILTMSDEELDAEIRAVGIDPAELDKRASDVAKWAAECSKLRARVGELEARMIELADAWTAGCEEGIEAATTEDRPVYGSELAQIYKRNPYKLEQRK